MSKKFINPEIWETIEFQDLSKDAKSLYIYLYVKCDIAGFIRLNADLFTFQTKIKDIDQCLKELKDFIKNDNGVLWLSNHLIDNSNFPLNQKNNAHRKIIHLFEVCNHSYAKEYFEGLHNTLLYNNNTILYSTKEDTTPLQPPSSNAIKGLKEGEFLEMIKESKPS